MTLTELGEAAELLGASVDTARRWIESGRLAAAREDNGQRSIGGVELAEFVRSQADAPDPGSGRVVRA